MKRYIIGMILLVTCMTTLAAKRATFMEDIGVYVPGLEPSASCSQATFSGAVTNAQTANQALLVTPSVTIANTPCTWLITSNLIVPSDVPLIIPRGSAISVNTGITLTINSPIDAGSYAIFEGAGTILYTGPTRVDVMWFGATGDGTTDDTIAIQSAFDALHPGGNLHFPLPSDCYSITDTLNFGNFIVDGNGNVSGFTNRPAGMVFSGEAVSNNPDFPNETPTICWDGANQPATTKITTGLTPNTYLYITDAKPMINMLGASFVEFRNISLECNNNAYAGFHLEGHTSYITFHRTMVKDCYINYRFGTAWDHVLAVSYFGRGDDPSYAQGVTMKSNGGWQMDTFALQNTQALNPRETNLGMESGQGVSIAVVAGTWSAGNITHNATSHVTFAGGQVQFYSTGFVGDDPLDASFLMITGTIKLMLMSVHDEQTNTTDCIKTVTTAGISHFISIYDSQLQSKGINVRGGGANLSIVNTQFGGSGVLRADAASNLFLHMRNVRMDSTTVQLQGTPPTSGEVYLDVQNVLITGGGAFFSGAGSTDWRGSVRFVEPASAFLGGLTFEEVRNRAAETYFRNRTHEGAPNVARFNDFSKSIADNTATVVASFFTSANFAGFATMHIYCSNANSASKIAIHDILRLAWVEDSGGVVTAGTATKVGATLTVFDGFASVTTTYSIAHNAGPDRMELTMTQDNDLNLAVKCSWNGDGGLVTASDTITSVARTFYRAE